MSNNIELLQIITSLNSICLVTSHFATTNKLQQKIFLRMANFRADDNPFSNPSVALLQVPRTSNLRSHHVYITLSAET